MPVNIASRPFELIIAGIDRTAVMEVINLSQPSTLEAGDAPVTGKITLRFSSRDRNNYTYTTSPTIAARFAVGALVTYRITDDSGDLVYHPLSGQQLFILKKPSPPVDNTLTLQVGCILAYQDQRVADYEPSGVTIGTDTPRNTVVERVLQAAGISNYSVPSLPYPFNCPAEKQGGSFVKMAAAIAKAVKHITYCNSAGQVIVAPINLDASPVATLTIGANEVSFEPVDGSAIPDVTELTISGVCQVPDQGDYPILIVTPQEVEYGIPNSSRRTILLVARNTLEIASENYSVEVEEAGLTFATFDGLETVMNVTPLVAKNIKEVINNFDSLNRLSQKITRKYLRLTDAISGLPTTPFFEIEREIIDYTYTDGYPSSIRTSLYTGVIPNSGNVATLYSLSRETVAYSPNLPYWNEITSTETFGNNFDGVTGSEIRTITANGVTYQAFTTGDDRLPSNFVGATRTPKTANDGSTRPPSIIYSEKIKTKNQEIVAVINANPIAGVASKEKHQPIKVDWLVSNEQAYEYGKLEIVLMNGRSQCRFLITQLNDELLALRPRCRIDIIFEGILYRCLVDAINFAQDMKRRTVGFMCDVISTSPIGNPSTVYKLSTPVNALRPDVTFDLVVEASLSQTLDFYAITFDLLAEAQLAEDGQLEAEITMGLLVNAIFN